MIKCGRCRDYHESVVDVRKCFNGESVPATQGSLPAAQRLSEKQAKFVHVLLKQLNVTYTGTTPIEDLGRQSDGRILLDGLVAARKAKTAGQPYTLPANVAQNTNVPSAKGVRSAVPLPDVSHGYYATTSITGNNDLDFWFVNRNEKTGFKRVSRVIGGQGNVLVKGKTARQALEAIKKAGEKEAGILFAHELGRCYNCGKSLTDELSRELGIGPVCRAA